MDDERDPMVIHQEFSLRATRAFGQVATIGGFVLANCRYLGTPSHPEITAQGPGLDMSLQGSRLRITTDDGEEHTFDLGEADELSFLDCFLMAVIMSQHHLPNVASPARIVAMFSTETFTTDMIQEILKHSARLFESGNARRSGTPVSIMDMLIKLMRDAL